MANILNKKIIVDYFNKNKLKIFIAILFVVIINILLKSGILYNFIFGSTEVFGDHKYNISLLKCHYLGFDVYHNNTCTSAICNFGRIFLLIPFNLKLEHFYLDYLPYIVIILFSFSTIFIISPKNKIQYVVLFLSIFNPSTLLLIERINFDIFIFLILIFIIFNRIYFINWILISFVTLSKFYPAILGINILLENKNRKLLELVYIILGISLLSTIYIYFNYEKYLLGLQLLDPAGYLFLFSLKTIPKIMKYLFSWNYIVLIMCFLILFALLTINFYKLIKKNKFDNLIDIYSSETKLFILGGYILLICYLIFSNYVYREVFLITLLPLLFKLHNIKNIKFLTFFVYFIFCRYVFLFIYGYINAYELYHVTYINDVRYFSKEFLFITTLKGIIDIVLMSFIGSVLFLISKKIIYQFKAKHFEQI